MIGVRIHISLVNERFDVPIVPHAQTKRLFVKDRQDHLHVVLFKKRADGFGRDLQRFLLRIAIGTGRNQRKRDAFTMIPPRKLQRIAICHAQQPHFIAVAAVPDGADRVDDIFRRQAITARDFGFSCFAAAKLLAFLQKLRPGGAVDGAVHTAPAKQSFVCRVDNGVNLQRCDIRANDGQWHDGPSR